MNTEALAPEAVEALLEWFFHHARDLPWRHERSPYRVWVSEIMLQQTQVDTVIPYFERFMAAFPDLHHLAAADEDRLMSHWAGLGYYSRARNLQKAARRIVEQHGGRFPEDRNLVRELPGFGEYTTAAVLSLSRGQDLAVLDGNVARVLSRVFLVTGDYRTGPVRRRLQNIADSGLPPGRAGQYNEALMELGATVCRLRPACGSCPLRSGCGAFRQGRQTEFPEKPVRPARPCYPAVVLVGRHPDGRVLLHRRTGKRLLGGLWELPVQRGERSLGPNAASGPEIDDLVSILLQALPFQQVGSRKPRPLPDFRHHYSHFSVEIHPLELELGGHAPDPSWRWVSPEDRDGLGISASDRRILDQRLHGLD